MAVATALRFDRSGCCGTWPLIWRQLPRNGVLSFFDVKPIAVKTSGGRRYTSARRPVILRRQKIRGLFSLFLRYEANSGRTR